MYLTERFARLVTGTHFADIPPAGIAKAKDCILDCLGAVIAGSAESIREPVMRYVEAVGGAADATLVGVGGKTAVTHAALANGVFGHVLDYDDTNQIFIGHGSVVIVPAILALAEKLGYRKEQIGRAHV